MQENNLCLFSYVGGEYLRSSSILDIWYLICERKDVDLNNVAKIGIIVDIVSCIVDENVMDIMIL